MLITEEKWAGKRSLIIPIFVKITKLFFTNEETSRSIGIWKRTDFRENLKRNTEDQGDCLDFEKAVSEQETVLLTQQSNK